MRADRRRRRRRRQPAAQKEIASSSFHLLVPFAFKSAAHVVPAVCQHHVSFVAYREPTNILYRGARVVEGVDLRPAALLVSQLRRVGQRGTAGGYHHYPMGAV